MDLLEFEAKDLYFQLEDASTPFYVKKQIQNSSYNFFCQNTDTANNTN